MTTDGCCSNHRSKHLYGTSIESFVKSVLVTDMGCKDISRRRSTFCKMRHRPTNDQVLGVNVLASDWLPLGDPVAVIDSHLVALYISLPSST